MSDSAPADALTPQASLPRWFAVLQVILVCGIPTQLVAGALLVLVAGMPFMNAGALSFEFVATYSLVDTAIVAILIRIFLLLSGESSSAVFVGPRPISGEIIRGV